MISLNPSGFACSFNEAALENLSNDNGGKKNLQQTEAGEDVFTTSFLVCILMTLFKRFGLLQ